MSNYLPPGCNDNDPMAPWNRDEYEAPQTTCDECRESSEVVHLNDIGGGEHYCDGCIVAWGNEQGDKDQLYMAAYLRTAKVTKATEGHQSASRRCMEALDTIDHAARKWKPTSERRIETMRYFLSAYGYPERHEEYTERCGVEAAFALNNLFKSFKPNTLRK